MAAEALPPEEAASLEFFSISVATEPPDLVFRPSRGGFFALSASERVGR
jgi:hypothetical protein